VPYLDYCVSVNVKAFKIPNTSDPSEPYTGVARPGALLFEYFKPLNEQSCLIQISHQPDATVFQYIILTFVYSSTCFGRSPAHHPELNDRSSSLWFYLRIVVIAVLCSLPGKSCIQRRTSNASIRSVDLLHYKSTLPSSAYACLADSTVAFPSHISLYKIALSFCWLPRIFVL
jgi:hypothetical protein